MSNTMTSKEIHKRTTEGILIDPSLARKERQRKSELFFKRFRQKTKPNKRYDKSDRALNKCRNIDG